MNITLLFTIPKIFKYLKYLLSSERYRIAYQRNIILFAANINSYQTIKMVYEELKYILESEQVTVRNMYVYIQIHTNAHTYTYIWKYVCTTE